MTATDSENEQIRLGEPVTNYRPHLDGVRTVAVYLVVLFHAGLPQFAGGFIGVDVFFVLSGYLITGVLVREHSDTGKIDLPRFYSRRVKRLLPAAIGAVLGTALLSTLFFSQFTRSSWTRDGQTSLLYVSNWHFIGESRDYFADDIEQSPFLHFWSLSVEEQFYFVFPVLLIALLGSAKKRSRHWIPLAGAAVVCATSLILQITFAIDDPIRAYYGTDTRVYQMAAGSLAAILARREAGQLEVARWRGAIGPLGVALLALLATSGVTLSASNRGILATIAALLVIVGLDGSPTSALSRLLGRQVPVYLGRVSYGTYLWHWPVIVVTMTVLDASSFEVFAIAAVVATALASLSYHLVEMPIRDRGR